MVNRNRKRGVTVQATIDETSGETLYNPDQISASWFKYYQQLYSSSSNERYDCNHKALVDDYINEILHDDNVYDQSVVFTVDQLKSMCRTLKKNKAAGWDNIVAEVTICTEY